MMIDYEVYPKHSDKTLMGWTKNRLVEEINILLHNWKASCEVAENVSIYARKLQEELDKIQNDNWISAKERLPEPYVPVLIAIDFTDNLTNGEVNKQNKWWSNIYCLEAGNVTHWPPLPQTPKENE